MPYNEKSKENLKSTVPGQVLNPKGKPKGIKNSKTQLRKWLSLESSQKSPDGEKLLDYFDAILLNRIKEAWAGDKDAVNFIFDRVEGKPVQSTKLEATINFENMSEAEKKKKLNDLLNGI